MKLLTGSNHYSKIKILRKYTIILFTTTISEFKFYEENNFS